MTKEGFCNDLQSLPLVTVLSLVAPAVALADPQLECSIDASSQVGIGECLNEAARVADATVALALEFAMQAAKGLDETTERTTSVPALTASQAGWEAYRDRQCEFVGTTYGGGSGTGIAIQSCRISLARARADDLMRYAQ